jgi:glucokinase
MAGEYLLAGDVGGTKTALAIARAPADSAIVARRIYPSREFAGLEAVLADFLDRPEVASRAGGIGAACFSVAGPVSGNACALTNLDWKVDGAALARAFGFPAALLINDFAAAGLGIALLDAPDFETLQDGDPEPRGARLVIGAGTGLGVGLLVWTEGGYVVQPSEAGHADFAPVDELQDQLLVRLRRSFGRVSCERVVSGPGLMRIFSFLQDSGAGMPSKQLLDAARQRGDLAEVIAEYAMAKLDPLAVRALELFVAAYGAFAGNLALVTLARGGVFIAGGIAPKIVAALREGGFMRAFTGKGRFSALLAGMPVRVVMNPNVGLLGALAQADRLRR